MANELYPVFEIPTVTPESISEEQVYKPSPCFDFEKGDFVRDGANRVVYGDGLEAYRTWVLKMLNTQYGACGAYPGLGLDYEGATSETARSAVQATFERVITECMLKHPMTQRVRDFVFKPEGDIIEITFTVQGRNLPALPVRYLAKT